MFYPNYDDYMRDVFYFNGLANSGMWGMNNSNLDILYPSIYRIIYPVVKRVVSGNNFQFANDDTVSNATNMIYEIVEGDTNLSQTTGNQSNTQNNQSNNNVNINLNNNKTISNDSLLKDLIRILVIRELISKNNVRPFPYYGPHYMNNQMMMPYM